MNAPGRPQGYGGSAPDDGYGDEELTTIHPVSGWSQLASVAKLVLLWMPAVIVAVAPWFYANGDDDYAGPVIMLGALQWLALALRLTLSRRLPRSWAPLQLLALLAWLGVATCFSISPFHSIRVLAVWAAGAAVFLGFLVSRPSVRQLRQITLLLVTSVAALSGYGLARAWHSGAGFSSMTATFSNCDCFGALVLMALALAMGLLPLPTMPQNHLLLADMLLLFTGLVATSSRAALIGALVAGGVVAWRRVQGRGRKAWRALVPGILAVAGLGLMAAILSGPAMMARFHNTFTTEGSQGWSVRLMVTTGWLKTLARSPWLGSGPGTFHLAFQPDRPHGVFKGYVNQAHIDLVQVAVENGLVGLALFLGLTISAIVRGWRCRGTHSAVGAVAGLIGVSLYGLVNFALPVAADLMWFFALLGLTFAYIHAASAPAPLDARQGPHQVCLGHVLGIILPLLVLIGARAEAEVGMRTVTGTAASLQADALRDHEDLKGALMSLNRAVASEPGNEQHYRKRGLLLQVMGAQKGSMPLIRSGERDLRRALALNPRAKRLRVTVAEALDAWGQQKEAVRLLEEACQGYPEDPGPWYDLSTILLAHGKNVQSAECLWAAARNDYELLRPLGRLLAQCEAGSPGLGASLLRQFASSDPEERGSLVQVAMEAANAASRQNPAVSATFTEEALQMSPDDVKAEMMLASLKMRAGDSAGTLSLVAAACKDGTQTVGSCLHDVVDAACQEDRACLPQAVALLVTYLHQTPDDNAARAHLAELYVAEQDLQSASRTYQEAIKVAPDDARLYAALGAVDLRRGDKQQARMMYMEASRLNPSNDQYAQQLAALEHQSNQEPVARP